MPDVEIAIVGAGVVGLAIAARLSPRKQGNLVVLEKNPRYGLETSSRNSEVIHAGIYYTPGSLKARLCVEGRDELYHLAKQNDIPHHKTTKLITATTSEELDKLAVIYKNGLVNGVPLETLDARATVSLEPNIRSVGAIFSPQSGVISAHGLMDYLYHVAVGNGTMVQHRCEVTGIEKSGDGYTISITENGQPGTLMAEKVINAAGLYADEVAAMVGIDVDAAGYRQSFAKGSYFSVVPAKARLISRLVYPIPSNEGAGVHALIDWGGRLKFGPDVEYLPDRRIDYAVPETKRKPFTEAIRRILPAISEEDIVPDMSGIRPKLQRKGEPPKDFIIVHEKKKGFEGFVNLIGIESPGLTASPAIARYVETLLE
jgi:L-2-hydroxyglutarate oxidase LhgO